MDEETRPGIDEEELAAIEDRAMRARYTLSVNDSIPSRLYALDVLELLVEVRRLRASGDTQ